VLPDNVTLLSAWDAGRLGDLVTGVLERLVGEPFMEFGRAADMMWLGFGEEVPAPTRRDSARRCAKHRLHASCPLRLDLPTAVLVASSDIYVPAEPRESLESFEWDDPGANLFDVSVSAYWRENPPGSVVVEAVSADAVGGIQLGLSTGQSLTLFPSRSGLTEHWRYFGVNDEEHFVILPEVPQWG